MTHPGKQALEDTSKDMEVLRTGELEAIGLGKQYQARFLAIQSYVWVLEAENAAWCDGFNSGEYYNRTRNEALEEAAKEAEEMPNLRQISPDHVRVNRPSEIAAAIRALKT